MKKIVLTLAVVVLTAAVMGAQSFQQAFFLDGYTLAYRYNPAIQNETPFISVGQFESQVRNNIGAASFLYPREKEVVTALHSSVSPEEFLGNLNDDNYINGGINYNLLSYGWRSGKSFHTLEANVRGMYGASVPKGIFALAKLGTGDVNYDLSGLRLSGSAFAELAYGYSISLSDYLSVGARAKLLVGIESLNYRVTRFDMYFSENIYRANVEADLDLTSHWSKIRADEDGYMSLTNMSAKDSWKLPSGAGLAFDFGVLVTPLEGLSLSASVLDLGGLFWYYGNAGKSKGETAFVGLGSLSAEDLEGDFISERTKPVLDHFLNSVKLKPVNARTSLDALPLNLNAAVKYSLPFYKALSVGATGTYLGLRGMAYREVRGALAWNPCSCFGVTVNGGTGSYGPVWGVALNAGFRGFCLTAGLSNGFGGTVPYSSYPLKANFKAVTFGVTYDL